MASGGQGGGGGGEAGHTCMQGIVLFPVSVAFHKARVLIRITSNLAISSAAKLILVEGLSELLN